MELNWLDIVVFVLFIVAVIGTSMYKSRKEETGEDYFLASRGLLWPLIGLSLIAANISTEQFVGMSGQSAGNVGLAIASYEWMAAITLVITAFFFLPKFLQSGIYTIPEFLEYRYNRTARSLMAFYTMVIYVGVTIAAVLYSGGLTIYTIFDIDLTTSVWLVGILAALYTTWGGLKAVAWADLFQGSALILGGLVVMVFGFVAVGGPSGFMEHNADKMHMILPADHPVLPWTALVIGLWIPNFYYWGLNQYITQRTLAAKTLRQGQLGIIFAAGLKLIIPFIIVVPGIMAAQLYGGQMGTSDAAYPLLIRNLIPIGLRGFMFAAIAGAVMSSLASMLNSAATIFTMDLYRQYIKRDASQKTLVTIGRSMTLVFVLIGCIIAPSLGDPKFQGIFTYIQEFQGYISPGVLAAFVFGLLVKRAPAAAGVTALVLTVPVYGFLQWQFGEIAFLNRMAITFVIVLLAMWIITLMRPLKTEKVLPVRADYDMTPTPQVLWLGIAVVVITLFLYIIFW
ncbi:solute:sodium symporter family transporter [candidate division KSB1 bacterium]|jgi:SSS family solute:Na+ symporter|nr:solute:sodium symporter family transporter [candidate division KSB1 bacterium]